MRTSKGWKVVTWSALLSISLLAGCSQKASRQDGDALASEVEKANRLCQKAMSLLSAPVYVDADTGKVPPLSKNVAEDKLQVQPASALNGDALGILDEAERTISSALAEHSGASAPDVAMANAMLGRIASIRGSYYGFTAANARGKADAALDEALDASGALKTHASLLKLYDSVMSMNQDEVKKSLAVQDANAKEIAASLQKNQEAAAEVDKKLASLKEEYKTTNTEAQRLLRLSNATSGERGVKMSDEARAKQMAANKAASAIAKTEGELAALTLEKKSLAERQALADAIRKVLAELIDAGQKQSQEAKAKRSQKVTELAAGMEASDKLAGEIQKSLLAAAADEKQAVKYYQQAGSLLQKSVPELTGTAKAEIAAQRGDAAMELAKLDAGRLQLLARASGLVEDMKALRSALELPGELSPLYQKMLSEYVSDPAPVTQEAIKAYQDAIEAYTRAADAIPHDMQQIQWAYQSQLAAACIGAYNLNKDPGMLTQAGSILAEAVKDKESSPNLQGVVELQGLVQKLQAAPAPAPEAAPAPAATPAPAAPEASPAPAATPAAAAPEASPAPAATPASASQPS